MRNTTIILALLAIGWASPSFAAAEKALALPKECVEPADENAAENCVRKYFVVQGQPINPRIIEELMSWISDTGNQIVAVDILEAHDSNRFFTGNDKITVTPHGKQFGVKRSYTYDRGGKKQETWFQYDLVGIENDIAILEISEKKQ